MKIGSPSSSSHCLACCFRRRPRRQVSQPTPSQHKHVEQHIFASASRHSIAVIGKSYFMTQPQIPGRERLDGEASDPSTKAHQVFRTVGQGNVGRAARLLGSKGIAPVTEQSWSKGSALLNCSGQLRQEPREIKPKQPLPSFRSSPSGCGRAVRGLRKGCAFDPFGWAAEHWRPMAETADSREVLAAFVNDTLAGQLGPALLQAGVTANVTLLDKDGKGGVRPTAVASCFRRLSLRILVRER